MALPSSGQIEFDDFNTDRGDASGTQVDMAEAGTDYGVSYNTSGTNYLQMDEFYGKSAGSTTPTYTITSPITDTTVNEGDSITFYISTTNVATGTTLYWTTSGSLGTVNGSDFTDGIVSGQITVNSSGLTSVTRTLNNDFTTESTEKFAIQIRTTSTSGPIQVTSPTITVNDTSVSTTTIAGDGTFNCISNVCTPAIGGEYASRALCLASCGTQ